MSLISAAGDHGEIIFDKASGQVIEVWQAPGTGLGYQDILRVDIAPLEHLQETFIDILDIGFWFAGYDPDTRRYREGYLAAVPRGPNNDYVPWYLEGDTSCAD